MPARSSINKMTTAAVAICLAGLTLTTSAQTPRRQDPAEVVRVFTELVQTDVMVFDKQGNFVDKLSKEDFELRIDGKVRTIEFFERVTAGTVNEESQLRAARGTAANTGNVTGPAPLDRGRTVFFYLDDLHLNPASMNVARKMLTSFIDKDMNQNDEVAITSASGQIGFLQQLTDNKAVLRAAVERLKHRPYSVRDMDRPAMTEYQALQIDREDVDVKEYFIDETMRMYPMMTRPQAENIVRARATNTLAQASNVTRNTLFGLASLVKSSRKLPGRKLVFFISDGFLLDHRNSDSTHHLQQITSDAARSGIVVYSLDARGLVAMLDDPSVPPSFDPSGRLARAAGNELHETQDAMHALAKDTGGRAVFNTNALDAGLSRALKESSVYYLLAWKPDATSERSSKFRRIEVKLVGKPDLAVRVRRGFYDMEPPPTESKDRNKKPAAKTPREELREALGSVFPERTIPIALSLNYVNTQDKKMLLSTSLQIPAEFLAFGPVEGTNKALVEIVGSVLNDQGRSGASFQERLTVTAPSPDSVKSSNNNLVYTFPVTLDPGLYQVRVAARDEKSGRTGSANAWIEVPDLSDRKLRLSSLIIGSSKDATTPVSSTDAPIEPQLGLSIDHQFKRDSVLRFLFIVYNSARAADSLPDVASQLQVLRDNQPVITTSLRKIPTAGVDLDRLPYAADLSLEGLPAGQYVLQVTVIDRVSKTSASQQTRFSIE